jgi:hypothetical protein
MMCNDARSTHGRLSMTRGATLAAALVCVFGVANPAAACSDVPPQTIYRPDGNYVCYFNCAIQGGEAREIRRITFTYPEEVARGGGTCMRECTATPGCTGYTVRDWWVGGVQHIQCIFYARSGTGTQVARATLSDGRDWVACHRQPPGGLWRDPRIQIETDIFKQDQYRPGAPGVPGPSIPKRP